jgi:uncharacterized protein (TIGR02118 family)
MIKVLSVFGTDPGWAQHEQAALALDGLRGYAVARRVGDEGDAPYSGYASSWFDDVATASAHAPALRTAGVTAQIVATELIQRDTPARPDMVKAIFFFHRRQGTTPEEFRRHWLEVHGPLAMTHISNLRRYIQNHTVDEEYADGEPDLDGLVEAWVDSMAAMSETEGTAEHAFVRSDEPNFLDTDRVTYMPVTERRVR